MSSECIFKSAVKTNSCTILHAMCTEMNQKRRCRFCKTEKQFAEERDRAILINRKKGNCDLCKYRNGRCKTGGECSDG